MTFLAKVTAEARERVAAAKAFGYLPKLRKAAEKVAEKRVQNAFRDALAHTNRINIIAEIKRASPSKGVIRGNIDVTQTARTYEKNGAAAISVLTEPAHFDGSIGDLVAAAKAVNIPVLRKDFIVDEYQIVEAAAAGASAILLIVAALQAAQLANLKAAAEAFLLNVLVEVHDEAELDAAAKLGADIIGVNNRDLHSLEVSLDVSRRLITDRPKNTVMIAESGISTREEIDELHSLGFDGFLIGETLMRTPGILGDLTAR